VAIAREVKGRIRSVENTRKITRTMEMVATSKLKKATDRVYAARPYAQALGEIVRSLYSPELTERYPLLRQPETIRRAGILILTANRGLAGAFNINILKEAIRLSAELRGQGTEVELHLVGRKGVAFFRFRKEAMQLTRTDLGDYPTPEEAESLVASLRDRFSAGELDAVYMVGSEFRSALSTPPVVREILPIRPEPGAATSDRFILSPSGDVILSRLLPLYIRNAVYRGLVENVAAEQSARRNAMKNATDNAGDILEGLKRSYNRARQAQITQEIAEIVGGASALE
jgi:F-type H+-transporting ATPase subunit gamma